MVIQAEPALERLADLAGRIDAPPVSLDHNAALEVAEGVYLVRGLIANPNPRSN